MSHKGGNMSQMESVRLKIDEHMTSAGEEILCVLEKQCGVDVCRVKLFVLERHSVAAELIYKLFQREMETLETLLDKQNKLLDVMLQPHIKLHRGGEQASVQKVVIPLPSASGSNTAAKPAAAVSAVERRDCPVHPSCASVSVSNVSIHDSIGRRVDHLATMAASTDLGERKKGTRGRGRKWQRKKMAETLPTKPARRFQPTQTTTGTRLDLFGFDDLSESDREGGSTHEAAAVLGTATSVEDSPHTGSNTDVVHLPVCKEEVEVTPEEERSSSLVQEEPEPPHIKEEQEEELLQRPEEVDKPTLTLLAVKKEDDDGENREPVASTSTEHMKTQADVEDCGTSHPTSDDQPLSPHCSDITEDSDDEWEPLKSHKTQHVKGPRLSLSSKMSQDLNSSKETHSIQSHTERKGFSCSIRCSCRMLPREPGQVKKKQRRSYDAKFKLMAINAAESSNNCQAARQYRVTESHIRKWQKQKECLERANSQRKAFRGPRSGRFKEIDRRVCQYVTERRNDGMAITRAVIQLKALEIAKELNIPPTVFKASLGWCKRMMHRNGVALRCSTSLA